MESDSSPTEGQRSLDVFEVGTLLQVLAQSQRVGTLRITSGSRTKFVSLDGGRVVAIHTPRSRFRIGRILYNMGAVEMDDLRAVLSKCESEGVHVGEMLVDHGLIRRHELESALGYQMVEELLEVFFWKDLDFEFFEGRGEDGVLREAQGMTRVGGARDAQGILLEVTRILDELDKFQSATPSQHDVYEAVGDPVDFLAGEGASEREREVATLIDGERDVSEVVRDARMNRFEVMALFYRLKSAGILRPKNAFELLMLAENRREDFSNPKRLRLLERAAELGLDGFDLAHRLARAYEEAGDRGRAATKYVEHSREMVRRGNLPAAREAASRAVRVDPDNTTVREFRARLLSDSHADNEMVEEVVATARLHLEAGRPADADRVIRAALSQVPSDERLLEARIDTLRKLGRRREAANCAISLSRAREEARDLDRSLAAMRRAVGIAPKAFRPRTALIALLCRTGDRDGAAGEIGTLALVAAERLAGRRMRALRVLDALVRRLADMGMVSAGAMDRIARRMLGLDDRERALNVLVRTGEARIAAGLWGPAREAFAAAVELSPDDLDLSETLALTLSRLGSREEAVLRLRAIVNQLMEELDFERAERVLCEILRLDPFSPDALLKLAHLKAKRGELTDAAARLHQIGLLYQSAGNLEDAAEFFDEACRHDPTNSEYVRALARCLGRVLKASRAIDTYDGLLAMLRARRDELGTLEVAFKMLELVPDHAEASRALWDSYYELGDRIRRIGAPVAAPPAPRETIPLEPTGRSRPENRPPRPRAAQVQI